VHTVEKIGGTSMSNYEAVRDNVVLRGTKRALNSLYNRVFVVSAYGGVTDLLLENKKTGEPGVYGLFAKAEQDSSWRQALAALRSHLVSINQTLFSESTLCARANRYIDHRLDSARDCLAGLEQLCSHGHFSLQAHLMTVREMLASIGEAHSAWNMVELLKRDGIHAVLVDLTGWQSDAIDPLDKKIRDAFSQVDLSQTLPIVTGYVHCQEGLMSTFDRGYSEMTFSRIAVLTAAKEAVIHKEYHLSSADPRVVGQHAVPIGRTNYDVADQLANLGMEAIHPKAAKGLRRAGIALRVKNTFEPEHTGTLITSDYVSRTPRVEIIAGRKNLYALELFDQDMMGSLDVYDREVLAVIARFRAQIITKDINANTITHYLAGNITTIKRIQTALHERFSEADSEVRKVALVSAIGSDMQVPGILAQTVAALAQVGISVLAVHQSMRQVDMQFIVSEEDYEKGVRALHRCLVEVHDHGQAICAA
jgi:aspartate kinase